MNLLTFNDQRYTLKGKVSTEKLDINDRETVAMVKEYFGADIVVQQHSAGVYLFLEKIQDAEVMEYIDNE